MSTTYDENITRREGESNEEWIARITSSDERVEEIGPPAGIIDRRRRKSPLGGYGPRAKRPGVAKLLAMVVSVLTMATLSLGLKDYWPETSAAAMEAHTTLRKDIKDLQVHDLAIDLQAKQTSDRLDRIESTQSKSLVLQSRAEKRNLESILCGMAPNAPGRANLERQLDEVNETLGDRGSLRCR